MPHAPPQRAISTPGNRQIASRHALNRLARDAQRPPACCVESPIMPPTAFDHSEQITHDDRLVVHRYGIPLPNGDTKQRLFVKHPGAVTILPLLDDNTIVLIKNNRPAIGRDLWELPAGTLEPDENPDLAAGRELEEETGYRAGNITPLCRFYTAPGFCDELMHAYVATDLQHVGQSLDDVENITAHPVSWEEVRIMMTSGELADAKTMTTLMYYLNFASKD